MSGVWREKSVPMTDHECALEALEHIGATIVSSNQFQITVSINGQQWTLKRSHGRYAIRYNQARQSTSSLSWMDTLSSSYQQAVTAKAQRLKEAEESATMESERMKLKAEREAFESQRQQLIEERRQEIHQKAKAMGYRVKESVQNGQVRLVLVRRG